MAYLNSLTESAARRFFRTACASGSWVESMLDQRPFPGLEDIRTGAETAFDLLEEADWLEAFSGHPRIGEPGDQTANREQSGVQAAEKSTLDALADVNRAYEDRFGFTYIVYAAGKTAEEMLAIAESRLGSAREHEIEVASREQRSITATRLRRMLCEGDQL
jgi:OHCU decarboxylase